MRANIVFRCVWCWNHIPIFSTNPENSVLYSGNNLCHRCNAWMRFQRVVATVCKRSQPCPPS